ncbi:MAG TPA: 30S ribosomal protein S24e [Thermoplasmatales archaeon]|nr:30S ribosomal protein S24e [Thermoplasmatales archaeon]
MEIEIVTRKENKLLEREEVYFKVKHEGKTPSRKKVRDNLGNLTGGKVVILEYLRPVFGVPEAEGYARIYKSEKKAKEVEAKHIMERNLKKGGGEEKKEEGEKEKADGEKPAEAEGEANADGETSKEGGDTSG